MEHTDDMNDAVLLGMALEDAEGTGWKLGLPPGAYYPGQENEYDVVYTPGGAIWHRRRP